MFKEVGMVIGVICNVFIVFDFFGLVVVKVFENVRVVFMCGVWFFFV